MGSQRLRLSEWYKNCRASNISLRISTPWVFLSLSSLQEIAAKFWLWTHKDFSGTQPGGPWAPQQRGSRHRAQVMIHLQHPHPLLVSQGSQKAVYLFYLNLPLVNQLPDHTGHGHDPRQHHDQGEKETHVVQEPGRKQFSHVRASERLHSESGSWGSHTPLLPASSSQATEHGQEQDSSTGL